jgi:hypothetical protein
MISLAKLPENIVSAWTKNQPKILFLLIIALAASFLRQLPYFNIILTFSIIGVFLWLVSLLLFNLRSKASVIVTVLALLMTGFAMTIQKTEIAQEAANFAYYLAIIAFIQVLLEVRNEKRKIS